MRKMLTLVLCAALLAACCVSALGEGTQADYMGKPLFDFSVETIDGETFALSQALEDHDVVFINIWATWCVYCGVEFPYLQEAWEQYGDRVAVIALSLEPDDIPEVLRAYAEENGLTFPIGSDVGIGLGGIFATEGVPTSVVVDRFGNVACVHVGAMSSTEAFTDLFDYFLRDGYTQTAVLEGEVPAVPTVDRASDEALTAAANAVEGALAFRNPEDEYTWPMVPVEDETQAALASTNRGVSNSRAAVCFDVTAAEGDALAFDFKTSLETVFDALFIEIDGAEAKCFTGEHEWTEWALPLEPGDHEIAVGCRKDDTGDEGEDCCWIANLRLVGGDEADALLAALPAAPTAEAFSMALDGTDATAVEFDDPYGIIRQAFGAENGWIVGDRATVKIALTAGDDPESAFVVNYYGDRFSLAGEAADGEDGYSVTLPVGDGEAGAFDVIMAIPGTRSEDYRRMQGAVVFADAAGADAFVDYLAQYGYEVGWAYAGGADGQEP